MRTFLMTALIFSSTQVFAWGGRGHNTICEAATFLIKEKELRTFLMARPHVMGHLCNIPDIYWRSIGSEANKLGAPAHFIDIEITGLKVEDVPADYKKIVKKFEGTPNKHKEGSTIKSIPSEFGSVWWRADQFFRRASDKASEWKKATPPTNPKEEQDENLAYNQLVYDFVVNAGLIGHFVGDTAQPFHSSIDYDGYEANHGGIHGFYEDAAVGVQPPDLLTKVIDHAKALQEKAASKKKDDQKEVPFLTSKTIIERMRALSIISLKDIPAIYAADPIKKPSTLLREKGMEIKKASEREPADTVTEKMGAIMVPEMARAAAMLAQMWDEAYVKIGKPKLSSYKNYKYPLTPDFVAPDYFDIPKTETK